MWMIPDKVELFQTPIPGVLEAQISHHHAGRVKAIATSWPAEFYGPEETAIDVGEPVLVIGRRGITLLVKPES